MFQSPHSTVPLARLLVLFLASVAASHHAMSLADDTDQANLPLPDGLEPAVAFWTRVYTEVDSASGFIHDDRHLDVVYETLYLNPGVPPRAQNRTIEKALGEYRKALLVLGSGKRVALTPLEKRALRAWGSQASDEVLKAAAQRLRFQRGQSDRIRKGLGRYRRWQREIREILEKEGLPAELAALPLVESSYDPRAVSKAGAVGLWQFMPATARRYLRVDKRVDERLDPMKSTQAAAYLLQHNYSVLKSWPLAITAYNHGLSGMRRAVRATGTDDLGQIVRHYETDRFGFASRNFYAAVVAAVGVSRDPMRYFQDHHRDAEERIALITPAYLPVGVLVEGFEVSLDRLRSLNPSLHHAVWNGSRFVPAGHELNLPATFPASWAEQRLNRLAEHFGFSAQKPNPYYEVRLGDSLSGIAEKYGTSAAKLSAMNRLRSTDKIQAGEVLRVPLTPDPEPLGAGGVALLAAQRADGGIDADSADLRRLIALLAVGDKVLEPDLEGESRQGRPGSDTCRADATEGSTGETEEKSGEHIATDAFLVEAQPDLAADPADYSVADDSTIEIQIGETLGHYADWLQLSSDRIRRLNGLRRSKSPLIVGRRLTLDFSRASARSFEEQRIAYHQSRQLEYFRRHHISGVIEHPIVSGDNLWLLAIQQYGIPLWLLRQYNPDINVDTVLSLGSLIYVPFVETLPDEPPCSVAQSNETKTGARNLAELTTQGTDR